MTNQILPDKKTDPGAYDTIACDQFGIDAEGNPIADNLTGTGSDAGLKEHVDLSRINSGPVARLGCFSFELDWAFDS